MGTDSDKLARTIGARIRQLRQDRRWNQVDLEANMDGAAKRTAISMYETGRRLPSMTALIQLARAFRVPVASLLLQTEQDVKHVAAARLLSSTREVALKVMALLDAYAER